VSAPVALVSGGAVRIGRAIVEHLAANGYDVAIHCNASRDEADSLAAALQANDRRACVIVADLADPQALARIVPQAQAALGPVTLLVNSASIFEEDRLGRVTLDCWDRQFAVNLRAPVLLAQDMANALPAEMEGVIVNVLDQRVLKLTPQFFSYTLTKSALHAATRTMAQALSPRIRVNAVAPGPTLPNKHEGEEGFRRETAAMPLGHGANPRDVAEAVLYLARATSVTGQTIAVDGGQHIAWQTPDILNP
jgi:NAD(P)-dependent dehydrogenase (short-subunit alcohol dehydrogenase family)